jgi:hypothetical protein
MSLGRMDWTLFFFFFLFAKCQHKSGYEKWEMSESFEPFQIHYSQAFSSLVSFLGKKMSFSVLLPNLDENSYGFRVSFLIKNVPSLWVGSSLASFRGRGEVVVRVQI